MKTIKIINKASYTKGSIIFLGLLLGLVGFIVYLPLALIGFIITCLALFFDSPDRLEWNFIDDFLAKGNLYTKSYFWYNINAGDMFTFSNMYSQSNTDEPLIKTMKVEVKAKGNTFITLHYTGDNIMTYSEQPLDIIRDIRVEVFLNETLNAMKNVNEIKWNEQIVEIKA